MPRMSEGERRHYREGELGPGVPERRVSSLPKVEGPQVWELSAHPHEAERAGKHIDLRLGDPATGIAHSFVLPKRTELPGPGEKALAVPTYDHTLDYMDYVGPISTDYGKGVVLKGRRAKTEVYHAEPDDPKKTLVRFNLYDGPQPEEFAIVRAGKGALLVNKTQTREGRPDVPSDKPTYGEVPIDKVDPTNDQQMMMPKLDGAHAIIDLKAGRSPRVYSYRVGKKSKTGLIEHTHKMPDLLKDKVPKELDGTILRGEVVALRKSSGVDIRELTTPVEKAAGLMLEYRHFAPTAAKRMEERGTRPRLRKTHRMYGAFDADKLVGMIRVNTDPLKEWEKDDDYEKVKALDPEVAISGLTVDPAHRRKGVAFDLRSFVQRNYPKGIITGVGSRSERDVMKSLNERMGFIKFRESKNGNEQYYWGPKAGSKLPGRSDALPAEQIGGLLNSKVWESRSKQRELGVRLQVFPFDVVRHRGRDMANAPFSEKLKVLREAERSLKNVEVPEVAESPGAKKELVSSIGSRSHPLTEEGVVAVDKTQPRYTKAKFAPDFDVYVRKVHPAVSGKTGKPHDRAGAISYSWTPDGPIVGQLGGFKHDEAKDMLRNPDRYVGRAAKVKAMKVFTSKDGTPGALFQPRFKEWHLDKGDIEKGASPEEMLMRPDLVAFVDELGLLQKEAAKSKAQTDKEARELAGAAIAASGLVGTTAAIVGNAALGMSLAKNIIPGPHDVEAIAEKMGIESPLVVNDPALRETEYGYAKPSSIDKKVQTALKNEGYSAAQIEKARRAGIIIGPTATRGPEIYAHEMGHAANAAKNKILTAISDRRLYHAAVPASLIAGGLMAIAPEDADSFIVKAAPAVPVIAQAPVLAEEALASFRGFKALKSLGKYSPEVLKKAKGNMIKAFGTYLTTAAVTTVPVATASAYRTWGPDSGKKKGKKKTAGVGRGLSSLFAHAYKEDADFRDTVNRTLSTDPNTRRNW